MDPRMLPGGPEPEHDEDRPAPSIRLRVASFLLGCSGATSFFLLMAEGFPSTVTIASLVTIVSGYFLALVAFFLAAGLLAFRTWAWYGSIGYLVVTVVVLVAGGERALYAGTVLSGELEIAALTVVVLLLVLSTAREIRAGEPS